ncbi:histidine phosphatase family protein [Streptomyces montanisoli]|uniref:Histidine phosphatase family protein n=1 Tax=Streptomyces montanisoli TaxID=2798581 RepID=A0A940MF82_9ACTN|nr:histidine phosphatase family protein [Streptomyces montanisoli]MBP0458041.1 histidine phosphatase family protein [Streptomyces montanisoli]
MGELILVRHGETEWTLSGQHTGNTDIPLTEHGEDQARAVAPLLADRTVGLVLVSPLGRTERTAELAGLTEYRVTTDLHEWDYGGYEGITTDEIHRTRPGWDLWTDGVTPGDADHPGETPEQVGARADRVLDLARKALAESDDDVALVSHGHFLRVLTARYLGLDASAGSLFKLETGTVSRLGTEHDRPVMTAWNLQVPESVLRAELRAKEGSGTV